MLVLPLLLLAACSTETAPSAPSPQQVYVAEAAKVCQVAKDDTDALTAPAAAAEIGPFVDDVLSIAKRAQGELAALIPPPADAAALKTKVLDPFAALVVEGDAFKAKVDAAGDDGAKLLPLLAEQPTADGVDLAFLRDYGLGVCADVLDTSS